MKSVAVAVFLRAALDEHAEGCERCNGPDDGCEFGASIENLMLKADQNAYDFKPQLRTSTMSQAVIKIMREHR